MIKTHRISILRFHFVVLAAFILTLAVTDNASSSEVTLWGHGGNYCYLTAGTAMPIWPQIPDDAISIGKTLELTITMPAGFTISAYGESHEFAMLPKKLIVPTSMSSSQVGNEVIYTINLPALYASGLARLALLVDVGNAGVWSYPMTLGLKTSDSSTVWVNNAVSAHVLEPLRETRPERMQVAAYDYSDYTNADFKDGISEIYIKSGINWLHNMNYYSSTDTVAQRLRNAGGKASWGWWWDKEGDAITSVYPQAKTLNSMGNPTTSLCYTWCILNENLAIPLISSRIAERNTPYKYDCVWIDNEEAAGSWPDKTDVYGDLYTPITIEEFRSQNGIPGTVVLTPSTIAANYFDEWVDFRCWQSAEMARIVGKATKAFDANIINGYYSGYKYTGQYEGMSKRLYATDWDMVGAISNLDFGVAGYFGAAYIDNTAAALGDTDFVHGEWWWAHFDVDGTLPEPNAYLTKLMKNIIYKDSKAGVSIWFAQMLDAGGFNALSRLAEIGKHIEDYLYDGIRCDSEISVNNIASSDVFAYKIGTESRLAIAFNSGTSAKTVTLEWNSIADGSETIEIQSKQKTNDPKVMTVTIPANSFKVFVSEVERSLVEWADYFNSYSIGELEAVASDWIKDSSNEFNVVDHSGDGLLEMSSWACGVGQYYAPASEIDVNYTVAIDFDVASLGDDGGWGVFARQQSDSSSVFARVYLDTNRAGSTAPTKADLWVETNDGNDLLATDIPVSYLENNDGRIELAVRDGLAQVTVKWGDIYDVSADFEVSGELLTAGPAGIYAKEYNCDSYYCDVNFDNFTVSRAAEICGDNGTIYRAGDLNADCLINLTDLSEMALEWMTCTDPNNILCEQ